MTTTEELLEAFKTMTLGQLTEFRHHFEDTFGVSAEAVVSTPSPPAEALEPEEVQTEFDVVLIDAGAKKIQVIKVVRELTKLGLKEAKDLVDSAPATVLSALPPAGADEARERLIAAGASVALA